MTDSYNPTPDNITANDFNAICDFDPEGLIPLTQQREYQDVSKDRLLYFLQMTAKAIAPHKQKKLLDAIDDGLIERVLGDQQSYNVSESLAHLRGLAESGAEEHLLQRTLSLISFDLLDPASVSQIIPAEIYEDLHIADSDIQPEMRKGGAILFTNFSFFRMVNEG